MQCTMFRWFAWLFLLQVVMHRRHLINHVLCSIADAPYQHLCCQAMGEQCLVVVSRSAVSLVSQAHGLQRSVVGVAAVPIQAQPHLGCCLAARLLVSMLSAAWARILLRAVSPCRARAMVMTALCGLPTYRLCGLSLCTFFLGMGHF
jgi:hypothetical protein